MPNSSLRGRLLVATPPLDDPNFDRTVVYMLEHHELGAVGVVLNRPGAPIDLLRSPGDNSSGDDFPGDDFPGDDFPGDDFPGDDDVDVEARRRSINSWLDIVSAPQSIFVGGPVAEDSLIAVARGQRRNDAGWGPVTDSLGTVDLSWMPSEVAENIDALRMFQGYSGWAPGQLEAEIAVGGWMVFDTEPGDVFTETPDTLWRDVVRRQGGALRWIADSPDDLSAN